MARRSRRIQEKEKIASSAGEASSRGLKRYREEDDEEEEEDDRRRRQADAHKDRSVVKRGNKRQRMPEQFRKVRGKRGLLERLAKDVPLDVILEIFAYLDPGDLLRLARTSKDLRGILMSKTSESIWRTARENVEGLPPCPPDLNEPQYAHLAFESYCHVCRHKGRCDNIFWTFRMRYCNICAQATLPLLAHDEELQGDLPDDILPLEWFNCSVVGNHEIAAKLKAEFGALQTEEALQEWIARKRQERDELDEHARLCERWHESRLDKRDEELQGLRDKRRDAILERLGEVGWREEAEIIMKQGSSYKSRWRNLFSHHKLVKQTKKLTDYGWNSIKDELVEMLSNHKERRLEKERRSILLSRHRLIQEEYAKIQAESDLRDPFPTNGDILSHRIIRDFIWDTPIEDPFTMEIVRSKLSEHLPGIIDEWRPEKIQQLVDKMRVKVPTATASDLLLATSVFECGGCHEPMHYPQMFYHQCLIRSRIIDDHSDERMSVFSSWYHPTYNAHSPWSSTRVQFSETRSQAAKMIVEACSLDPTTATPKDVHMQNPLIECSSCKDVGHKWSYGRLFTRWPQVLSHHAISHLNLKHLSINSFGEDTNKIVAAEPKSISSETIACCAYCHKPHSFWNLADHLKDCHGDVVNGDDLEVTTLRVTQTHWYRNPRYACNVSNRWSRYKEEPAESSEEGASAA
ncbi:hypothetical protein GYMLUDRAFT_245475 [Collybiopsis luxurians FD-317 M1]|uniref:F-box domain-containing protein n=1 Tax=Collybiopsis luxurians FD-317 M1 TaxID=944289 RepID=A0A0D0CKR1_9AGAR|nr:hypothetical protein GYMLUDRAFT_245475 [Collybiopsis luxurians FD-317 M1]